MLFSSKPVTAPFFSVTLVTTFCLSVFEKLEGKELKSWSKTKINAIKREGPLLKLKMEELSVFFLCSAGVAHGFKDGNGFVACTIKDQRKWHGGWFSRLLKMMEEEARWLVLVMELLGFFFLVWGCMI